MVGSVTGGMMDVSDSLLTMLKAICAKKDGGVPKSSKASY